MIAFLLASCVVSIKDPLIIDVEGKAINLKAFIVDTKTWCYDTDDEMEAYYLCSILNSKIVDDWIKPLQNKGQWGERDIHRRPLMLPIPSFQSTQKDHTTLALLGKKCRKKVSTNMEDLNSRSIGKDKNKARELLHDEMKQIDNILSKLIPIP